MKRFIVSVAAFILVSALFVPPGVITSVAADQPTGKEAAIAEAGTLVQDGQMLIDSGNRIKEGKLDMESMMKAGEIVLKEGKRTADKGSQTKNRAMIRQGKYMIVDGMRMKNGRVDMASLKKIGEMMI